MFLSLLFGPIKAFSFRAVPTSRVELCLERKRAENPILSLILTVLEADGDCVWYSTIFNPGAHLIKNGSWLSAIPTRTVLKSRNFKDAEEVVHIWDNGGNSLVVSTRTLRRNSRIGLEVCQSCFTSRISLTRLCSKRGLTSPW